MKAWTAKERDQLRAWRLERIGVAECARRFGRTYTATLSAIRRYGLREKRRTTETEHDGLMSAYRRGLSDRDIAAEVHIHERTVLYWRRRHDLPGNGLTERTRKKMRANMRRLDREAGMPLGLRWRFDDRLRARELGWSVPLARHERAVCSALLGGALTAAEIAERTGRRSGYVRNLLPQMGKRGILVIAVSARPFRCASWSLAPGVEKRETA